MELETRPKGILRLISAFRRSQRGNVAVMFGLLLIPIVGTLALGTEVAGWLVLHRAEQNAADSAAMAAAAEGGDGTGSAVTVGTDLATQYGFTAGTTNGQTTTVTIATDTSDTGCTGGALCYKATVRRTIPISLAAVVGYTGPTGNHQEPVTAVAVALATPVRGPFCISATGTGGKHGSSITIDGGGSASSTLTCNVFGAGDLACNGSHAQVTSGVADSEGDIKGNCGKSGNFPDLLPSQVNPTLVDPFAADESSIPSAITNATIHTSCNAAHPTYYPDSSSLWNAATNTITDADDGQTVVICGDAKVASNVIFGAAVPTTIIIENGNLDLAAGSALTSALGSGGVTVIFTGAGGNGAVNGYTAGSGLVNFIVQNGGLLNIFAPSSQSSPAFSGVALFQDTNLPFTSPSFGGTNIKISGGVDASRSDLDFSGANKSSAGLSCFTLIVDSLSINGNAGFLNYPNAQAQCPATQQVTAITGYTGQLVQ